MLKNILKLEGAALLSATEQKMVVGGRLICIRPDTGECKYISKFCGETICQPGGGGVIDPVE